MISINFGKLRALKPDLNQGRLSFSSDLLRWSGWTGKLALAGLGFLAAYLAVYVTRPFGDKGVALLSDFGEVPLELICVAMALAIVRREPRSAARTAWAMIALAILADAIANTTYGVYDQMGQQPFPSIADIFYLAFYPLTFIGLFWLPTASDRREILNWRVWTNIAIIILGGGIALIHFVVMPTLEHLTNDSLSTVISLAYPAGDLALIAVMATIINRRPFSVDRLSLSFFTVAIAAWFCADLVFAILSTNGVYAPGGISDLIWLLGAAAFLAAAHSRLANLATHADVTAVSSPPAIGRIGPQTMVIVGLITLILAAFQLSSEMGALVGLSVGLTVIVVMRQTIDDRERRENEAEKSAAAAKSDRQARHDQLTGLLNRASMRKVLCAEITASKITGRPLTLVFLDLNFFKAFNDRFGHGAGDSLLVEIGHRLAVAVRANDTVARLGGDEFAIILPGVRMEEGIEVVNRIQAEIERPFLLGDTESDISAAIGLVSYPDSGALDDDVLIHQADTAMDRAKQAHLGPTGYDPSFEDNNSGLFDLAELRRGIAGESLVLLFQPILECAGGRIVGAEALVRWQHPTRGLLGAGDFVPLAAQTGLIRSLDRRVFALACAQARIWREENLHLRISINVSRDSLQDSSFADYIREIMRKYELSGEAIDLEITEEGLLDDPSQAGRFVAEMRDIGVRMSIDDFGTGYSSLARLRNLPVGVLKIDQSFVRTALVEPADAAIVESVIALGHRLGMEIIAEGVEDQATLDYLKAQGVDMVQGYLLGRPMPAADVSRRVSLEPVRQAPLTRRAA